VIKMYTRVNCWYFLARHPHFILKATSKVYYILSRHVMSGCLMS